MSNELLPSSFQEPSVADKLGTLLIRATEDEWHDRALCKGTESDLFYYLEGERGAAKQARTSAARLTCQPCPVRDLCMASSINKAEVYGFWGASEEDRELAWEYAEEDAKNTALPPMPRNTLAYFHLLRFAMPSHPALQNPQRKATHAR